MITQHLYGEAGRSDNWVKHFVLNFVIKQGSDYLRKENLPPVAKDQGDEF
jgi:hypothetical protein